MCGRYGYTSKNKEHFKKLYQLLKVGQGFTPRFNIAPGQDIHIILNTAPDELTTARWGLIPVWAKDEKVGYKMTNARAETIFEKPTYKRLILKQRCLILADCFYEWKKEKEGKQPYCIRLKSKEPFAFAGIWDCWKDELISCSIITCEPNKMVACIHDRMPVILRDNMREWLSDIDEKRIKELMTAVPAKDVECYKISKAINIAQNNDHEKLIEAIA